MPFLQMPDGRYFKYADDLSFEDAAALSKEKYPKAWGEEVGGLTGMAGKGIESLISSGRTAFGAVTGSPEEAAAEGVKRKKAMGEKYKEEIGLDLLKKRYEEEGLWGGAKEVARQVPLAISEQLPNIGATIAGGRTGAALGSFFGPAGTVIGGLGGAAIPSLIQQFGGNIERQQEEGKQIDVGGAFGASIPQAGLDVVGNMIPFGKTLLGKAFGKRMEDALAAGATKATEKLAEESLKKSLAKGLGVGALAEIPTEVSQQMLERYQAGLSLTSDDALAEYGNTAYQVGLLAPIGSVGRVVDRSAARQDVAEKKAAEARTAAEKAEAERLASPAYFDELTAQQTELEAKIADMNARLASGKVKNVDKLQGKIEQAQGDLTDIQSKLAVHPLSQSAAQQAQAGQLAQIQAEETGIPAELAQQQEEARLAAEEQAKQQRLGMGTGRQMGIPGAEPVVGPEARPNVAEQRAGVDDQVKSLSAELLKINARIEAQQKELAAAAAAGDTTKAVELMTQAEKDPTTAYRDEIQRQLDALKSQATELKKADPAEQLKALLKEFKLAGDEGNFEAIKILAPQIESLKQQVGPTPAAEKKPLQQSFLNKEGQPSLFAEQAYKRRVDEVLADAQKDIRAQVKKEKPTEGERTAEEFQRSLEELEGISPTETTAYPKVELGEKLGVPQAAKSTEGGRRVLGRPATPMKMEQANEMVDNQLSGYLEAMDELSGGYFLGGKNEKLAGPMNESLVKKEDIVAKAEEAKNKVIDAALAKADNARLDRSMPRLDDQAAMALAKQINDIFAKHTSEGGMAPQMPGRINQAIAQYAKPTLDEQRRALSGKAEDFALAPQTAETLAAKVAEEEGAGKTNRSDVVAEQLQKALDTKPTGAISAVLEEAKRIVDTGKAPTTLLDEAEAQSLRILNGKTPQMRSLYDETVIAKEGKVTEEKQQHFPQFAQRGTIRQTAEKFRKFLNSPRIEFKRNEYVSRMKEFRQLIKNSNRYPELKNAVTRQIVNEYNDTVKQVDRDVQEMADYLKFLKTELARPSTAWAKEIYFEKEVAKVESYLKDAADTLKQMDSLLEERLTTVDKTIQAATAAGRKSAKEMAALKPTTEAQRQSAAKAAVAFKEAMDAKEKANREWDLKLEEAAKLTPKVVSKVVEEEVSANDIRGWKQLRTKAKKDLASAEKSLDKMPDDEEFQQMVADAKTRLANTEAKLAEAEKAGAQIKGQPKGAMLRKRVIERTEPTEGAISKKEEKAEARKEALRARVEKMQQQRAEAKAATKVTGAVPTSVIKLRDTIERINKRLNKIPTFKPTLAQEVERIALENRRKDLDAKLESMLKAVERPGLAAAKYERAGSNIVKPVEVVRSKKATKAQDKKLQELETFSTDDLGAIADAFQEAGLAVVPESDQFNFSEQTISGMNFSEKKPSGNSSNGMKGALLSYFQDPAEFDKHVTVFQNADEAKKSEVGAKALSQASNPYRVQAFTDAKGHVYMIADAVVPGQELAVFLHEVGVHAGMERLIGAENMAILSSQINTWAKLPENTLEGSIARAAVERAEKSSSKDKTEERIAYFVEEAVKAGVDPIAVQKTGSPFAQWFRTLIAAMKSALRKIGLARFEDLTAQNIVDLAYGAAKLKMTGRWHGTAADFRRFNHAFMNTGEGAQAFGWGTYLAERVGIAKGYWKQDIKRKEKDYVTSTFNGVSLDTVILDALEKESLTDVSTTVSVYERFAPLFRPAFTELSKDAQMKGVAKAFDEAIQDTETALKDFMKFNPSANFGDIIDATDGTKLVLKEVRDTILASPDSFDSTYHKNPKPVGSLMYIDTAIHDNEYLDHNVLLKFQPEMLEKIRKGVPKELLKRVEVLKDDDLEYLTGRDFYSAMESLAEEAGQGQPDKFVSLSLDKIGIKGLKFLDSQSRPDSVARRKLERLTKRLNEIEDAIRAGKPYREPAPFTTARVKADLPLKPGKEYSGDALLERRDALRAAIEHTKADIPPATRNYIVFNEKNMVRVMTEIGADPDNIKFSESAVNKMLAPKAGKFNSAFNAKYPGLSIFGDSVVAKDKSVIERVTANATGMRFAIQFVDRFAGLQKVATTMKDKLAGFQMMYWLRIFDQRNNLTAEAASVGVPVVQEQLRADGKKEFTIGRSQNSSNLREIVQEVGKAIPDVGDADATMRMFSLYRMARRIKRLDSEGKDGIAIAMGRNISPAARAEAKKQFAAALEFGEGNVHFKAADEMYTRYTRALINFLAQSGAISREAAALLNKGGDYIGFYREKDGLIVDGEHNVTMGDLTTQPYLKELLGGDTAIVDFRTSSLQNTNLIISMALNNLATRNAAITLTQLGLAKSSNKKGPAGDNVVRYKVHGEDWHMVVDPKETEKQYGIPADLLVKGMRGVSTTLPAIVRLMQGPANLLRKGVTRMPTYAVRQVVRDSLNAYIAGGVDGKPIWNSVKEIRALMAGESEIGKRIHEQGLGGGQVFSGAPDDVKRLMTDIMAGTKSWSTAMAWLDKLAVNADTATRAAAYKSFRDQGMSDMEASLAALEMTNFSKRGVSPSMAHMATMIPFFNAQIQGLNALWQALTKTGIASERLDLKNKLLKRGALMMAMTVAYAAMMSDDEGYKNLDADKKLANWVFYLPGTNVPVYVPIPFEVGFVFKAIPEAMMLAASKDGAGRDVVDALARMAMGSVPGGSSFFIPQAAKPAIEVLTGKNLYDFSVTEGKVGDIESSRMKQVEAGLRKGPGTSGVAAALGEFLNVSPIKIDHLIRGYGGGMGAFLASAVGTIPESLGSAKAPAPEKRPNELAIIGGLFAATDGRGLIDRAYNKMEDINQAAATYKKLKEDGDEKAAFEYGKRNAAMINASTLAGQFRNKMGDLAEERRAIIAAKDLTPKQKREAIDAIRQKEIYISKMLNSIG